MKTEVKQISENIYLITIWITENVSHSYRVYSSDLAELKNQISAALKN